MILSIIAAVAASGIIYAGENAAQRGITRVINNRKAEKAGCVPATAYPYQPPFMQQPMLLPPQFMQQAAAEAVAAQAQQTVQAPVPDPTPPPAPAPAPAPDAAAGAAAAVIAELTAAAKEIAAAAAAAQAPAPAPESGNPYKVGDRVHLVIEPENGIRHDLYDIEVPAGINDGTVNKIIDDNTVVVTVPESGAKNAPRKKLTLLIDDISL